MTLHRAMHVEPHRCALRRYVLDLLAVATTAGVVWSVLPPCDSSFNGPHRDQQAPARVGAPWLIARSHRT
jgi:hypothetical protein